MLTPAYNGYGNEDDLYAMGLSLEPLSKEVNQEEYDRYYRGLRGCAVAGGTVPGIDACVKDLAQVRGGNAIVVAVFVVDVVFAIFQHVGKTLLTCASRLVCCTLRKAKNKFPRCNATLQQCYSF